MTADTMNRAASLLPRGWAATLGPLAGYGALVALSTVALVVWSHWSHYHHARTARPAHARRAAVLSAQRLRKRFGVSAAEFDEIQHAQVLVVHHNADGAILAVTATLPPTPHTMRGRRKRV